MSGSRSLGVDLTKRCLGLKLASVNLGVKYLTTLNWSDGKPGVERIFQLAPLRLAIL